MTTLKRLMGQKTKREGGDTLAENAKDYLANPLLGKRERGEARM